MNRSDSYSEVKTIIKVKQHSKWMQEHLHSNRANPYYQLTRSEG